MDEGQNQNGGAVGGIFSSDEKNENGGFESFGNVGMGQPINRMPGQPMGPMVAQGDVVVGNGGQKDGRSKKGLIIGLTVLFLLVVAGLGVFAMWKGGVFGKGDQVEVEPVKTEIGVFYDFLDEQSDSIAPLMSMVELAYEDDLKLASFMVDDEDIVKVENALYAGLSSIEAIKSRLESGINFANESNEAAIRAYYEKLSGIVGTDLNKYEEFVKFLIAILQAYYNDDENVVESLMMNYDESARMLVDKIRSYRLLLTDVGRQYSANGCDNSESDVCVVLTNQLADIQRTIDEDSMDMGRIFLNNVGVINYDGEDSLRQALNDLREAVRKYD